MKDKLLQQEASRVRMDDIMLLDNLVADLVADLAWRMDGWTAANW